MNFKKHKLYGHPEKPPDAIINQHVLRRFQS